MQVLDLAAPIEGTGPEREARRDQERNGSGALMASIAPFDLCPKCQRVKNFHATPHVCPPEWIVWNPDEAQTDVDARHIYAEDAETAVELWAENDDNDSAEYNIAKGKPAIVYVQRFPTGPVEKYKVSGEYEPRYMAEPVQ